MWLKAPPIACIPTIFELSIPKLTKSTGSHKFPPALRLVYNEKNTLISYTTSNKTVPLFSDADVLDDQVQDPVISRVLNFKQQGRKPPADELGMESPGVKILLREWDRLYLKKSRYCDIVWIWISLYFQQNTAH